MCRGSWVVVVLTIFDNWCASRKLHAYVPLYPPENVCMCMCSNKLRCFCYCVQRAATTDNSGNTSYYYIR